MRDVKVLAFALFAPLALCVLPASATTYYVRTDGSDQNNGLSNSASGAFRTIGKAVDYYGAGPGDTVLVADGTYAEDEIKIYYKQGSSTNRLVIKAMNKWGAKISSTSAYWGVHIKGSTGVTVQDFEIFYPSGSTNQYGPLFSETSDWVTLKGNYCYNGGLSGIQANETDNLVIEDNVVTNNSKRSSSNGSGISIASPQNYSTTPTGSYGITVRNNIAYANECRLGDTSGTFEGNTSNPTDGNGIILDRFDIHGYGKRCLVENNLSFNNGGHGIHIFKADHVDIRNNTLWHNNYVIAQYWSRAGDLNLEGNDCAVDNNIVVENPNNTQGHALLDITPDYYLPNVFHNNIFVGSLNFERGGKSLTSNGGSGNLTSMTDTYPQFVNPTTGSNYDFRLQASSPAVDSGDNSRAASKDLDGKSRPINGVVDRGAYERSATTTNLVSNPSFESDYNYAPTPTGWSEWSNLGGVDSGYVETYGGAHSGSLHGTHYNSVAYNMYTYQVKTGIANGLYTLRCWAKSSGGQAECFLEAKDYGGSKRTANLPVTSTYQLVEIKDINVTAGKCTIGIWSNTSANLWCHFDDVEFFKQ